MSRSTAPPASIQRGLSRVVAQVSLAWSLAVFAVVWGAVHVKIDDVLDSAQQESAEILYGLLSANAATLLAGRGGSGGSLPAPPHDERLVWQIVAPGQRVVWRSHRAPALPLASTPRPGFSDAAPAWRVYGIPFDTEGTVLYVAQPHAERRQASLQASAVTAGGALLVGLACALWLRRRVARELAPLLSLSRQVAAYHPLEAGSPPPQADREELVPVRDAVVHLGNRLAQRVVSERAFSANAAHALRTPLAGLGAQLALALRESSPAGRVRIERAREAADRLSRVVTALLTFFRTGGEPRRQAVDLAPFLRELPIEGLVIDVGPSCQVQVHADPDLLSAALLNLLDNALRYGAGHASFSVTQERPLTVIRLVDDGPGVDLATHQRLTNALAAQHYDQAMGLGLMLADRVARAHGGRATLGRADPGQGQSQGFCIELSLAGDAPAAEPPPGF